MTELAARRRGPAQAFGGLRATDGVDLAVRAGRDARGDRPERRRQDDVHQPARRRAAARRGRDPLRRRGHHRAAGARRARAGLARSFQITSIFREFSALDNVALAVQAHAGHSFRFWRRRAQRAGAAPSPRARCCEQVGLGERADVLAANLAHGEQRQLEIAMALATRPRLLLLDEPMAGMGPDESERMVALLAALKGRQTILLVEHDMDAVFALADRISVLVYGRVIASGTPAEIRANAEVRAAYLGEDALMLDVQRARDRLRRSQVLFGVSLRVRRRQVVDAARPQRHGQDDDGALDHGHGARPKSGHDRLRRRSALDGLPSVPHRAGRPRPRARGAADLPEPDRAREPRRDRREPAPDGRDPWTLERVFALFPALRRAPGNFGNQLSGGEQQMLAIGRALMTNPRLLILDEATEGLAPLIRAEIWRSIERLKAAACRSCVIDKNVEALTRLADRHYILEKGRVVWSGTSAELAASEDVQHRYLGV